MRLEDRHVGIVGVGLIGGSIAAALRKGDRNLAVSGWDHDEDALESALARGILTEAADSLGILVSKVDLLILALPIRHLVPVSLDAFPFAGDGLKAVLDVASVRAGVEEELADIWGPRHLGFHPMAGIENGGVENASEDLFRGAAVAIVPSHQTSEEVKVLGMKLASAIEAIPLTMGSVEHDDITACVSHLPMIVASALALVAGERMEELPGLPSLAAGGFRDTTRVASGPSWLVSDVWARNGKAIGKVLIRLVEVLQAMEEATPGEMERLAEKAGAARKAVLAGASRRCRV
ncbi:MAG: prephenate dehydrogenase [Thermovirga sp.]